MHHRKKWLALLAVLIVISLGLWTAVSCIRLKDAQENMSRQLHLFGKEWPKPVSKLYDLSANDFIAAFGQPNRIEYERPYREDVVYSTTLYYDIFCVNYLRRGGEELFANIMVTSRDAAIWRDGIKAGSTRAAVEAAFSGVAKDPAERDCYFDSLWAVGFRYTEEEIVEEIILYPPW